MAKKSVAQILRKIDKENWLERQKAIDNRVTLVLVNSVQISKHIEENFDRAFYMINNMLPSIWPMWAIIRSDGVVIAQSYNFGLPKSDIKE